MSKYGKYTGNQVEDLMNRIGGERIVDGILSGTMEFVAKMKETAQKAISYITATYKQTVNYDCSVEDSVKAGKYDWSNESITDKNFPSAESGKREVEFGLFHFRKAISSKDVIAEMDKSSYRPATIKELLAFGEKNPGLQKKFSIIGLGSVTGNFFERWVSRLDRDEEGRYIGIIPFNDGWGGSCRFLAVRK